MYKFLMKAGMFDNKLDLYLGSVVRKQAGMKGKDT